LAQRQAEHRPMSACFRPVPTRWQIWNRKFLRTRDYHHCRNAVETWVSEVERVGVRFEYRVLRAGDEVLLCTGSTVLAATDRALRPRRLPAEVREALEALRIEACGTEAR